MISKLKALWCLMTSHLGLWGQYCCSNLHSSSEYWGSLQHSDSRRAVQGGQGCPGWCRRVRAPPFLGRSKLKPCRRRPSHTHSLSSHSLCSCNVKLGGEKNKINSISILHFAQQGASIQHCFNTECKECPFQLWPYYDVQTRILSVQQVQPDSPGGPEIRSSTADEPKHAGWRQSCPVGQTKWNPTRGELSCQIPNAAFCSIPLRLFHIDTESCHCFS